MVTLNVRRAIQKAGWPSPPWIGSWMGTKIRAGPRRTPRTAQRRTLLFPLGVLVYSFYPLHRWGRVSVRDTRHQRSQKASHWGLCFVSAGLFGANEVMNAPGKLVEEYDMVPKGWTEVIKNHRQRRPDSDRWGTRTAGVNDRPQQGARFRHVTERPPRARCTFWICWAKTPPLPPPPTGMTWATPTSSVTFPWVSQSRA